jgi:integrase
MKLTNTAIDALQPGKIIRDESVVGLHVKAQADRKSFYLYFRTKAGVERRPKLGEWGILTIAQAREIARGMLAEVAQGRDPSAERRSVRGEPTIDDLWTRCEKERWHRGTKWDKEARRLYLVHIRSRLGTARVKTLRYADVEGIKIALKDTPNQANRAIAVLSMMLNLAERWEWRDLGSNPCQHLERYTENKRRRYATKAEFEKLGPLLESEAGENPAAVAFLYLLIYSGARPSEIARATWGQLERRSDGTGVLRIPEGKTGHRSVFLPRQAIDIINRLPNGDLAKTITGLMGTPVKVWNRIRTAAGCPDLWARDFRRTFATVGFNSGLPMDMVGGLLGNKSIQTTKNHYAMLMEDPAALAAGSIAAQLEEMLG